MISTTEPKVPHFYSACSASSYSSVQSSSAARWDLLCFMAFLLRLCVKTMALLRSCSHASEHRAHRICVMWLIHANIENVITKGLDLGWCEQARAR